MKTSQYLKDLQNKTVAEIAGEVTLLRVTLAQQSLQNRMGSLPNYRNLGLLRKQIAKSKTVQKAKEAGNV